MSFKKRLKENILEVVLLLILLLNIIILFIIDGPWWGFFCITLWVFISIIVSHTFYRLLKNYCYKRKEARLVKSKISFEEFLKILRIGFVFFTVALILTFPFFMGFMTHLKAEANRPALQQLVADLIKDADTDDEKTHALLEWFDEKENNIFDDYDLWRQDKRIFSFSPWLLKIFSSEPYIGFRTFDDRDSLWVLTSRYGHCGEFSLIFRDMAHAAGLTVRRVICPGEDHVWNEVLINDSWIIVDSTAVNLPNGIGYNFSHDFMERKRDSRNVSYVYAEYPDWTTEDITYRYTNLTNITIRAVESNGKPVSDVKIKLLSSNYGHNEKTELTKTTNEAGQCTFAIGGGDYTFIAEKGGIIPLSGQVSGKYFENQSYNVDVVLRSDFIIVIILLAVGVFISIVAYGAYRRKNGGRMFRWMIFL